MPESVRLRTSKLGFAAPDRRWLSQVLRPQVNELLSGDLRCHKYVDQGLCAGGTVRKKRKSRISRRILDCSG